MTLNSFASNDGTNDKNATNKLQWPKGTKVNSALGNTVVIQRPFRSVENISLSRGTLVSQPSTLEEINSANRSLMAVRIQVAL